MEGEIQTDTLHDLSRSSVAQANLVIIPRVQRMSFRSKELNASSTSPTSSFHEHISPVPILTCGVGGHGERGHGERGHDLPPTPLQIVTKSLFLELHTKSD